MKYCLLNGSVTLRTEAFADISDLGITRGVGMFDFFRVYQDVPQYLDDHLDRVFYGCEQLNIQLPFTREQMAEQINQLVKMNGCRGFTGMRILITGGTAPGFSLEKPGYFVTQEALQQPAGELYSNGATLLLDEFLRDLPAVKSTNYLHAVRLAGEMRNNGAIDILYHTGGVLTECARSNVFVVRNGKLFTPGENVLHGITRKRVLELAPDVVECAVAPVTLDDLVGADEVFITSTIKRIIPVTRIAGIEREWQVGETTRELMDLLERRDEEEKSASPISNLN